MYTECGPLTVKKNQSDFGPKICHTLNKTHFNRKKTDSNLNMNRKKKKKKKHKPKQIIINYNQS